MKVIVIGATGTLGRTVTQKLLEDGHEVTAFARDISGLVHPSKELTRVSGDALDADAVAQAINGQDAVVVALGAGKKRKTLIRSQGTLNVIKAMQDHGVSRLICQSTLGAHDSWDTLNFFWKRIMFGAILRPVFKDHELQEQLVQASGLDWTIVRPSAFDNGPATGNFMEDVPKTAQGLKLKITLEDIAGFVARQLHSSLYMHRAVGISN